MTQSARKTSPRGYGQYCALARALDVVGDRWTLLIVRELLLRGPCRYTDVRSGLPGIATNLLVARLRELETAGLVAREDAPPPVAATLLRLTPRGEQLRDVLLAIGRWGAELLGDHDGRDAFLSHWLALPFELHLADRTPGRPPIRIEVRSGGTPILLETVDGAVRTRVGAAGNALAPDAIVTGPPHLVLRLLVGKLSIAEARKRGLRYEGRPETLARVQPIKRTWSRSGTSRRVKRR